MGDHTPQPFPEQPPYQEARFQQTPEEIDVSDSYARDSLKKMLAKGLAYEAIEHDADGTVTRTITRLQQNAEGRAADDPILAYEDAKGVQRIDAAHIAHILAAIDRDREQGLRAQDRASLPQDPLLRELPGEAEGRGN